jgi:hypothetical protein
MIYCVYMYINIIYCMIMYYIIYNIYLCIYIYTHSYAHKHTYLHTHTWTAITTWACAILQLSHVASLCVIQFLLSTWARSSILLQLIACSTTQASKQTHKLPLCLGNHGVKIWCTCMYDSWNTEVSNCKWYPNLSPTGVQHVSLALAQNRAP